MKDRFLSHPVQPDIDCLLACIGRKGIPRRVHTVELFLDAEVQSALVRRFGLAGNVNPGDPFAAEMTQVSFMRFLGHESVRCKPDGMCVAAGGMSRFCECLVWLMGYKTLCCALVEARDLERAIRDRVFAFYFEALGLLLDVGIDAKHSFEDTIQTVEDARRLNGSRIAVLGGIDVDFLCRSNEQRACDRTRRAIERCMQGGGWCLGTGSSVANYIPPGNYLAMLDERWN